MLVHSVVLRWFRRSYSHWYHPQCLVLMILQSSRDGRQRPASAGSLKRLASAPGLVLSPSERDAEGYAPISSRAEGTPSGTGSHDPGIPSGTPPVPLSKPPSARRLVVGSGATTGAAPGSSEHPTPRGITGHASNGQGIAFWGSAAATSPP